MIEKSLRLIKMKYGVVVILLFGFMVSPQLFAGEEDDALFKSCPGLSAWAAKHPRGGKDMDSSGDSRKKSVLSKASAELSRRVDNDQRVRAPLLGGQIPSPEQIRKLSEVDADNLKWLKDTFARYGFPTAESVGQQGVQDFWLLVQHADSDPAFQQTVLDMLIKSSSTNGVRKADVAILLDRVHLAQGKHQRYGTQFVRNEDGELVLQEPVEDLASIDARRAQMDLMPLGIYQCVLRATYEGNLPVDQ
ncbi:DUF6624 domain-containing protein [Xanthomonas arboricola]|uniref:DUF6624 domain-containing protein n=1 Tax=Xanthomonas arboricola TaxID=56448 RepID=UPI0021589092|nr:DUF6624 domain-containing protein [Xanthomonas arboricola]